ncbi:uncharacterized protein A1O5_01481 [Cladophialophora psammophila CBS 110553]|uniref:Zn(2)-C6 fungal-type domain-containing protein n=1 Tax=Cladophialophora psammophila CBS 110553 TaxID=1182543 RepID=W9XCW9_9EURO|nr:uncharacterized protein A1O5_01481 [Cladophialophora psammophila CBS 110553]EXJ74786.1 hypothetical protein A1O5_01481 [Cladophialophora psammophila CBS 110553]
MTEPETPPPQLKSDHVQSTKQKRARTGCLTCRKRRLKCDKGLPNCRNCQKFNRKCKRGVRLNFIDVHCERPPRLVPRTRDWKVSFQDDSRDIASEYQGGREKYLVLDPEPKRQKLSLSEVTCDYTTSQSGTYVAPYSESLLSKNDVEGSLSNTGGFTETNASSNYSLKRYLDWDQSGDIWSQGGRPGRRTWSLFAVLDIIVSTFQLNIQSTEVYEATDGEFRPNLERGHSAERTNRSAFEHLRLMHSSYRADGLPQYISKDQQGDYRRTYATKQLLRSALAYFWISGRRSCGSMRWLKTLCEIKLVDSFGYHFICATNSQVNLELNILHIRCVRKVLYSPTLFEVPERDLCHGIKRELAHADQPGRRQKPSFGTSLEQGVLPTGFVHNRTTPCMAQFQQGRHSALAADDGSTSSTIVGTLKNKRKRDSSRPTFPCPLFHFNPDTYPECKGRAYLSIHLQVHIDPQSRPQLPGNAAQREPQEKVSHHQISFSRYDEAWNAQVNTRGIDNKQENMYRVKFWRLLPIYARIPINTRYGETLLPESYRGQERELQEGQQAELETNLQQNLLVIGGPIQHTPAQGRRVPSAQAAFNRDLAQEETAVAPIPQSQFVPTLLASPSSCAIASALGMLSNVDRGSRLRCINGVPGLRRYTQGLREIEEFVRSSQTPDRIFEYFMCISTGSTVAAPSPPMQNTLLPGHTKSLNMLREATKWLRDGWQGLQGDPSLSDDARQLMDQLGGAADNAESLLRHIENSEDVVQYFVRLASQRPGAPAQLASPLDPSIPPSPVPLVPSFVNELDRRRPSTPPATNPQTTSASSGTYPPTPFDSSLLFDSSLRFAALGSQQGINVADTLDEPLAYFSREQGEHFDNSIGKSQEGNFESRCPSMASSTDVRE